MNQQDSVRYQVANIVQDLSEQGLIETLPRMDCELIGRAVQDQLRPRVVQTIEELDALPDETVVRDSDAAVFEILQPVAWASCPWTGEGKDFGYPLTEITLPATVLYLPEEQS